MKRCDESEKMRGDASEIRRLFFAFVPMRYCVRGETRIDNKSCGLVFCTVGVLIRKVLDALDGASGGSGVDFTHLVIDEAHERSMEIDFLLMLIGSWFSSMPANSEPPFKVVIMSATLDNAIKQRFKSYGTMLDIPGRTFPVDIVYDAGGVKFPATNVDPSANELEKDLDSINFDAVASTAKGVLEGMYDTDQFQYGQAVLIFMPGVGEISRCCRCLQDYGLDPDSIMPLHANLPVTEQKRCFTRKKGKIVVATNVCETSVTIPDITCVIDSCRERRVVKKNHPVDGPSDGEQSAQHQGNGRNHAPTSKIGEGCRNGEVVWNSSPP